MTNPRFNAKLAEAAYIANITELQANRIVEEAFLPKDFFLSKDSNYKYLTMVLPLTWRAYSERAYFTIYYLHCPY